MSYFKHFKYPTDFDSIICKLEVTEKAKPCLISNISINFLLENDSVATLEFKMAAWQNNPVSNYPVLINI